MNYPTLEQVEAASQFELGRWLRFLDSPGMSAVNRGATNNELDDVLHDESKVMLRIRERFQGWGPELSKAIGWDKPQSTDQP